MKYQYFAFGLNIWSELELPELNPGTRAADVIVSLKKIKHEQRPTDFAHSWVVADGILLYFAEVGYFQISPSEICIDPCESARPERIRLFLLGAALGALLQLRGRLTLHASAVGTAKGAVAFLGHKGWGKSTLSAMLAHRGYDLVTDDILSVDFGLADDFGLAGDFGTATKPAQVDPGFGQLKLWPESLAMIGQAPDHLPKLHERFEKRGLNTGPVADRPSPLKAIYLLGTDRSINIERYQPRQAVFDLLVFWYAARFSSEVQRFVGQGRALRQIGRLAQELPVFLLSRPFRIDQLEAVHDAVHRHIHQFIGGPAFRVDQVDLATSRSIPANTHSNQLNDRF